MDFDETIDIDEKPTMNRGDWRSQLLPISRQRIANMILDTLKRNISLSGQEGLQELMKLAEMFEGKVYTSATSEWDYLQEISNKMLTVETKSQNTMANSLQSNSADPTLQTRQAIGGDWQDEAYQKIKVMKEMYIPKLSEMYQKISTILQQQRLQSSDQVSGTMLQPKNEMDREKQLYHSQRALPETSSTSLVPTAQTGQATGSDWQEEVYQKIKVMKEMSLPELSDMYQKIATKLQQHDSLPQEQLEKLKMFKFMLERLISVLQISKSSISPILKDKWTIYEKQIVNFINTNRPRKPISSQRQGQLPPPHIHSMQQSQSQIPQVQSLDNQMNPQLQSMNLPGSVATMLQNNMKILHENSTAQQNMMNSLQPSSNLDPGQGNTLNSLQQVPVSSIPQAPVSAAQQANMSSQSGVNLLQANVSPLHSNSGMFQPQHIKQQEQQMFQTQQRLQASDQVSGTMLQSKNEMDQEMQLYQSQRALPETSSTSLVPTAQTGQATGSDWQEEVYQKIKVTKEMYLPELSEMYQKIATKLQQHDSFPQQPKSEQLEKLKMFKSMLERLISVLQISRSSISPGLKDKWTSYEKQIVNFIDTNSPRKPISSQQRGQLPPPHIHSMQQSQSQIPQVQSLENQMNPQLQSMNLPGYVATMQQNNMMSLQEISVSSLSGVSTAQQNMMNSLQPSSNMDPEQGNALNSLQQVPWVFPVGSTPQAPVSAPQQANMSSEGG